MDACSSAPCTSENYVHCQQGRKARAVQHARNTHLPHATHTHSSLRRQVCLRLRRVGRLPRHGWTRASRVPARWWPAACGPKSCPTRPAAAHPDTALLTEAFDGLHKMNSCSRWGFELGNSRSSPGPLLRLTNLPNPVTSGLLKLVPLKGKGVAPQADIGEFRSPMYRDCYNSLALLCYLQSMRCCAACKRRRTSSTETPL